MRARQELLKRSGRLRLGAGAFIAVAALGLAACGSAHSTTGSSSGGSAAGPKPGGTLVDIQNGLGATFDPAHNFIGTITDAPTMGALYGPGLLYEDASGNVKMGFAKSLTTSDGGTTWTLTLRPGLKFSDGTAFNAQAVVDDMKRLAAPATASSVQAQAAQVTTTAPNATTVKYTLQSPDTQFPTLLSQDFALIPSPKAIASEGSKFETDPVGPGPFMMGKLTPGTQLQLVRNPYYKIYAPGQPYLDNLTIEANSNVPQLQGDLQTGQAQTSIALQNGQQYQPVAKYPNMKMIYQLPGGGGMLAMNASKAPFNNPLAREAVYLAMDRSKVAPQYAPGNPVWVNYFPKNSPYYDPSLNWPTQNSAKAQQLFNELAAQGHPVNFTVLYPQESTDVIAQLVAATLNSYKNVHVKVSIQLIPAYLTDMYDTHNYQMTGFSATSSQPIPATADLFGTGGSRNVQVVKDAQLNTDIRNVETAKSQADAKKAADALIQRVISQYYMLPLTANSIATAYDPTKVGGVTDVESGWTAMWGQMYLLNP